MEMRRKTEKYTLYNLKNTGTIYTHIHWHVRASIDSYYRAWQTIEQIHADT